MKFDLLSPNLVSIINRCLENNDLTKLIYYNQSNPLSQPILDSPKSLFMTKIFPFRYSGITTDEQTQLRIYYPRTKIKDNIIESTSVYIDVICHNNLYLIKDQSDNTLIRPYKILTEFIRQFDNQQIDSIGTLKFEGVSHIPINESYSVLGLEAIMITPSGK